jgi:hypothetical protein
VEATEKMENGGDTPFSSPLPKMISLTFDQMKNDLPSAPPPAIDDKVAAPKQKPKQAALTDYFQPVRRSSRKTKAALTKEKEWQIAQSVRNFCEEGLLVSDSTNMYG